MHLSKTLLILLFVSIAIKGQSQIALDSLRGNALKMNITADGHLAEMNESNSGKGLMYAAGLWITGVDTAGQMGGSFHVFNQHLSWKSGPLSSNPNSATLYNSVWRITRTMVDSFANGLYGAIVPAPIANWPAHGNTAFGESFYLAPFIDVNSNGSYSPAFDGDYPCFPGDEAIFFMFNDDTTHTITGSKPLGIEVLGMAYAYQRNNFLDSAIFVSYTIRNKTMLNTDFTLAIMSDFDIGNGFDDLVGTFADQNAMVAYNANAFDSGPLGWGANPPAAGVVVLRGQATKKPDIIDNDKDGCIDAVRDAFGNCQPISVANNIFEHWKMSNTMYFNNTASNISGNPQNITEFNNYMNSRWKNGFNLVIDSPGGFMNNLNGDGFIPGGSGVPIDFCYPGSTFDTSGAFFPLQPTNWYEAPANAQDKRAVTTFGKTDSAFVGEELQMNLAFFYARDTNTINSYDAAYEMAKKINAFIDTMPMCSGSWLIQVVENESPEIVKVYPNPFADEIRIEASGRYVFEIFDSAGKMVLSAHAEDLHILNTGSITKGFYTYRIVTKRAVFTGKLIK